MNDDPNRLRRLRIRCWRRGTKEMDLLLGRWADERLEALGPAELDALEAVLAEDDQQLYAWIAGREPMPARHAPLREEVRTFAEERGPRRSFQA